MPITPEDKDAEKKAAEETPTEDVQEHSYVELYRKSSPDLTNLTANVNKIAEGLSFSVNDGKGKIANLKKDLNKIQDEILSRSSTNTVKNFVDLNDADIQQHYAEVNKELSGTLHRHTSQTTTKINDYLNAVYGKAVDDIQYSKDPENKERDLLLIERQLVSERDKWQDASLKSIDEGISYEDVYNTIKNNKVGYNKTDVLLRDKNIRKHNVKQEAIVKKAKSKIKRKFSEYIEKYKDNPELLELFTRTFKKQMGKKEVFREGGKLVPKFEGGNYLSLDNFTILQKLREKNGQEFRGDPNVGHPYAGSDILGEANRKLSTAYQHDQPNEGGSYDILSALRNQFKSGYKPSFSGDLNYTTDSTVDSDTSKHTNYSDYTADPALKKRKQSPISTTGIGPVQWKDIIDGALVYKAYKNKIAKVNPYVEDYTPGAVRAVRGVHDLDASTLNTSANNIAAIGGSGYQGSDPYMSMINNLLISKEKRKAKQEFTMKRANFIEAAEIKKVNDMNLRGEDIAKNRQGRVAVANRNEERKILADHANATSEVNRTNKLYEGIGAITTNIQKTLNSRAQDRMNMKSAGYAEKVGNDESRLFSKYKTAGNNYTKYKYEREQGYKDVAKSGDKKAMDKFNAETSAGLTELEGVIKTEGANLQNFRDSRQKNLEAEYDRINKGKELLPK